MQMLRLVGEDRIEITPEARMIKEFRELYERDKSEDKYKANSDLAFVYFITSVHPDNPMRNYGKEERMLELKDMFPSLDVADPVLLEACVRYERIEIQESVSLSYVRTALIGLSKLRMFIEGVDLNERDGNGKPIHSAKAFADYLKGTAESVKALTELEKQVRENDMANQSKIRGDAREEFNFD